MGSDKILSAWEATCHAVGFLPVAVPREKSNANAGPSNAAARGYSTDLEQMNHLILPSPAVTCSDWGTPRALGQDVEQWDVDPSKQVINLSDFV